ncbi:hypothetical protein HII31_05166 [Pseudocercospora fuligena]|uniref:Cobalamin-independent methionine synthase MetE C-terminal/archaeal domain-containing protein n=1 Tax=Pseudocercospora fuligena TaxID=685502 RepID=A0A8H6RMS7_9PEZI|nr:hypothetical protein HII31_05166 [Pseudocercospora fuligena]
MAPRPPPFRAEHIGSLLRSQRLLQKRNEIAAGAQDKEEVLRQIEDEEIGEAVELQQRLGYYAVTDGEFRRALYWGSFFTDLEGKQEITVTSADANELFRPYGCDVKLFTEEGSKGGNTVICVGKIKWVKSSYLDHFMFLKNLVPPDQVKCIKMTLASPEWYHMRYKPGKAFPKDVYANSRECFDDIAAAFREEIRVLYEAGCRNFVIDNPNLGFCCDQSFADGWAADDSNDLSLIEQVIEYIEVMNYCFAGLPSDAHTGVHLCRGNFMSRHWASGGYLAIARELFTRSKVDTFYLEFDTERAGGFEPLRCLPAEKSVVLGLVTTKFAKLEDKKELKSRVLEAARYMAKGAGQTQAQAMERISVSPQCGFASAAIGNLVSKDDQAAKLKLVRELADELWLGER